MEETTEWAKRIAPAAVVQKRTWPVLVHGVRVADYPRSAGEKNARRIETENNRLHPGLKIKDVRWLGYVEGEKEYASLIMRIDSATQANRLIQEGIVIRYDMKNVETYDPKCRVTQCFKCQQYGHISPDCTSQQRCGFCGGQHITEQCADKSQAISKCCAACKVGDHASWSQACPARQREIARAKQTERFKPKLFPVSAPTAFAFSRETEATQATSMRGASATPEGEWTMVDKKRKLNVSGRPIGALNRAKTIIPRPEDRSILSFT
jgi:Zinc knuckle